MPLELKFGPPSEAFLQKHGTFYCSCCKREGLRTKAELVPLGWPRSISMTSSRPWRVSA